MTKAPKAPKTKLPQGVSAYRDRHGVLRFRYRAKGRGFELGSTYGSDEFWKRLAAAQNGAATRGLPARYSEDSIEAVARSFLSSPRVRAWAPGTGKAYFPAVEELRREHGHRSIRTLETRHVEALMAVKVETPAAANRLREVIGMLCKHAMRLGLVDRNVASAAESYRYKSDGFRTWTEAEITRFLQVHRPGTVAHTAFSLMLHTGAARVDVVALGWPNVVGDRLIYRRQKTKGQPISIPITGELSALLRSLPRDRLLFLETAEGRARSANGLGNLMREACDKAGLPDCSSHGLRKACARRLAEAGCTSKEIASITGHETLAEVQRYTRAADRAGLANSAIAKLRKIEK